MVGVCIDYNDIVLRQRLTQAGGQWDHTAKLWRLPYRQVKALGLLDRVVTE